MRCGRRRRGGGGGDAPTHPPPVSLLPGADCGTQHYKYLSLSEARAYKDRHEPRLVLVRAVKGSGAEFDGGESDGDDDDDDDVTAAKGSSGSPASPPLPRLVHRPHPLLATHTGYHPFCARRPRRSDLAKYGPGESAVSPQDMCIRFPLAASARRVLTISPFHSLPSHLSCAQA